MTCDAHFWTRMSYSSQKSWVEIWFGLVEIGGMLILRGGYMWPTMPNFELGRGCLNRSHMWKFGSDWLRLSRVIVRINQMTGTRTRTRTRTRTKIFKVRSWSSPVGELKKGLLIYLSGIKSKLAINFLKKTFALGQKQGWRWKGCYHYYLRQRSWGGIVFTPVCLSVCLSVC